MIYTLLLMWYGPWAESGGGTELIEGFKSYEDCNTAYQEILKQKPNRFKTISGVCMQVKDVR